MSVSADEDTIKKSDALATRQISQQYADKAYCQHRDIFLDIYVRFCELIEADYDAETHPYYHEIQQVALFKCLEIKPDCVTTLRFLQARSLYTSIVSNIDDDMLEPLVEREGLAAHLYRWTSSEAALSCKPDQRFFAAALEKSGLSAEQVLFVGDSPEHDIVGANRAGMNTVLIVEDGIEAPLQTGHRLVDPDHLIRTLNELKTLI